MPLRFCVNVTGRRALDRAARNLDVNVRGARIALRRSQGEILGCLARDLELARLRAHADGAHLTPCDAAAPADERQQPARLGPAFCPEIHAKHDGIAREIGM